MGLMRWTILLVPIIYYVEQNHYFGWNSGPQSDTELISDGINMILIVLAALAAGRA